ncbi:putative MYST-like histone acetyltransferase 1 [Porphyridium purpureum]|uniref:Histone acetyltransferase n=1 Tax=Porphyridium purpureum TaxID=35688 RepID=A0A5J4YXU5_PORPP|nr:putative MYST-like histone acetyltransferase 1 [Porphyridium purpureum]|eukprot:POR6000..scf209_3
MDEAQPAVMAAHVPSCAWVLRENARSVRGEEGATPTLKRAKSVASASAEEETQPTTKDDRGGAGGFSSGFDVDQIVRVQVATSSANREQNGGAGRHGGDSADAVQSPSSPASSQVAWVQAKIIAKRIRALREDSSDAGPDVPEYYVHILDSDRRLDRWVCYCVVRACEPGTEHAVRVRVRENGDDTVTTSARKRRHSAGREVQLTSGAQGLTKVETEALAELEKLREQKTKVKNIRVISFGEYEIDAWYFSPYPLSVEDADDCIQVDGQGSQLVLVDCLHICPKCLKYYQTEQAFVAHSSRCKQIHPPGILVYHDDQPFAGTVEDNTMPGALLGDPGGSLASSQSAAAASSNDADAVKNSPSTGSGSGPQSVALRVYEVDGTLSALYCQNLCLLAKLFLDHKTLYFDVGAFLFYVVCEVDMTRDGSGNSPCSSEQTVDVGASQAYNLVGFFSKEKPVVMSPFNLACILTLPPHQSKGYGKFMVALSYELTRRERKIGAPETPLSDLGLVLYKNYWAEHLLMCLKRRRNAPMTLAELCSLSGIQQTDVISTLKTYNLLTHWRGEYTINCTNKAVDDALASLYQAQEQQRGKKLGRKKNRVEFRADLLDWEIVPVRDTGIKSNGKSSK